MLNVQICNNRNELTKFITWDRHYGTDTRIALEILERVTGSPQSAGNLSISDLQSCAMAENKDGEPGYLICFQDLTLTDPPTDDTIRYTQERLLLYGAYGILKRQIVHPGTLFLIANDVNRNRPYFSISFYLFLTKKEADASTAPFAVQLVYDHIKACLRPDTTDVKTLEEPAIASVPETGSIHQCRIMGQDIPFRVQSVRHDINCAYSLELSYAGKDPSMQNLYLCVTPKELEDMEKTPVDDKKEVCS